MELLLKFINAQKNIDSGVQSGSTSNLNMSRGVFNAIRLLKVEILIVLNSTTIIIYYYYCIIIFFIIYYNLLGPAGV